MAALSFLATLLDKAARQKKQSLEKTGPDHLTLTTHTQRKCEGQRNGFHLSTIHKTGWNSLTEPKAKTGHFRYTNPQIVISGITLHMSE